MRQIRAEEERKQQQQFFSTIVDTAKLTLVNTNRIISLLRDYDEVTSETSMTHDFIVTGTYSITSTSSFFFFRDIFPDDFLFLFFAIFPKNKSN